MVDTSALLLGTISILLHASYSWGNPELDESLSAGLHVKRVSITDEEVCLRGFECGVKATCRFKSTNHGLCTPLVGLGKPCASSDDCADLVFCKDGTCQPQAKLNERCSSETAPSCRPGLNCEPAKPAALGASCARDDDCDIDAGHYCGFPSRRCAARLPEGAISNGTSVCPGSCISAAGLKEGECLCKMLVPLGGVCMGWDDCRAPFRNVLHTGEEVTCNQPRGYTKQGVCTRVSELLRALGEPCDPRHDLCDAMRGLSCRFAPHLLRTVCQQRYERGEEYGLLHCTPGSRLSACPGPKRLDETQCRTAQANPGDPYRGFHNGDLALTLCRIPLRSVPLGADCSDKDVECERGSVCRIVDDLGDTSWVDRGHRRAVHCVKEVPVGAKCSLGDKLHVVCALGLKCEAGACIPSM